MSQIYCPEYVELFALLPDAFCAMQGCLGQTAVVQRLPQVAVHLTPTASVVEYGTMEEDAERWDGLS